MLSLAANFATLRRSALQMMSEHPWVASILGTATSTYALDVVATAAGQALLASGLLQDASRQTLVLALAGTYAAWGVGIDASLKANWPLLEEVGASTNVLSRVAYASVKRRTDRIQLRKLAAASAYLITEAAKELPYYLGAFGAALVSESVSTDHALILLVGANLGAAGYEYGLARGTRAVLRSAGRSGYASFDTDWVPGDYLRDYYSVVEPDEQHTIAFFVDAIRASPPNEAVLIFGVGPTLHHAFLAAERASELHLGDYLAGNLHEIERWTERRPGAHDWRPFVRHTLECEGRCPDGREIAHREDMTRRKIAKLCLVDLRCADPLKGEAPAQFGTVISAYCADSTTSDRDQWELYMSRIIGLVRPGGSLLTAALHRSNGYWVGGKLFPSAHVDEDALRSVLTPWFADEDLTVEVRELENTGAKGYASILLACGHGRRKDAPVAPACLG